MNFPVGGRIIGIKFYTSNTTWNRPSNCTSIIIAGIGGGGGGGTWGVSSGNTATNINGGSGGSTSFGSILTFGGGSGGSSTGNGASGTITGTTSAQVANGLSRTINLASLFSYGSGGAGRTYITAIGSDPVSISGQLNSVRGGNGAFGALFLNTSLNDSYSVVIGSGGSGAIHVNNGTSASTLNAGNGEAGTAGAVLVIEFGG